LRNQRRACINHDTGASDQVRAEQWRTGDGFQPRLTPSAQHYTHLGDRAQDLDPAATMLFNGYGEELTDEQLDKGRVGGVPDARCPAYEAPRPAVRPAERAASQQYSNRLSRLGRDGGRLSL